MNRRSGNPVIALLRRLVVFVVAGLAVFLVLSLFRVGSAPRIEIKPAGTAIGRRTDIAVHLMARDRGLAHVKAELVQGGKTTTLKEVDFVPRPFWAFWGAQTREADLALSVGRETVPTLVGGEAIVRITATRPGTWLRRNPPPSVQEVKLPVRLTPPALHVASSRHYVAQGGCEAVVYRVGEGSIRDGVQVGDWFFPGQPLPGGQAQDRFALFAIPYDIGKPDAVRLVARDDAGNEAAVSFVDQFFPRPMRYDTIELTDPFFAKVVPEIMAQTPSLTDKGGPLPNYLAINGDLRRANNAELKKLADASKKQFLWKEPFATLPGGKVMSNFADRRTYLYNGEKVDQQDHLGFDLASTEKAPVPAANAGLVVLSRYFGIYGNTVVLDHGYGLLSLYAHLSSIDVKEGQSVSRGQVLGRSGQTGLAGGDHLHFTMVLQGLTVTPVEWWDAHWIQDRLAGKLGAALPYAAATTAAPKAEPKTEARK